MSKKQELKSARLEQVNQFVRAIGDCGRRFFWSAQHQRYGMLTIDFNGRIWWLDDYTGKKVYTHNTSWVSKWRGFSHGGTLRSLVEAFRDYVLRGEKLSERYFVDRGAPFHHPWGYGDDLDKVRMAGLAIGIIAPAEQEQPS